MVDGHTRAIRAIPGKQKFQASLSGEFEKTYLRIVRLAVAPNRATDRDSSAFRDDALTRCKSCGNNLAGPPLWLPDEGSQGAT